MNCRILFALFAVAVPLAAGYGSAPGGGAISYLPQSTSNGLDELVQAANGGSHYQQGQGSLTGNGEIQPTAAEAARLGQVQAQLQALNSNPTYRNLKNSDAIAESLAQSNLASSIRQGNINVVAPNVVDQGVYRSLLVPSGQNNHQVIATQPLPPIIVNQPELPPTHIGGGPAAIVRAAPVIYKIKPSVIYQQEVINKVPTPLSLNPVYVKVYKPGKKVDAPTAPVVQPAYQQASPSYGQSAPSYGPSAPSYGPSAQSYGPSAPSYAPSAPSYVQSSQSYSSNAQSYGNSGPAPSDSYGNNQQGYPSAGY